MQQSKPQHQTQSLRRCGLHVVNNLLQTDKYTSNDFDRVAEEMKRETNNSHYTYFLGNYDLNVIERILLKESYELQWIRQNQAITEELMADESVEGLLINKIKEISLIERLCQWEPRHWVCIRKSRKSDNTLEFYYHDSQLKDAQLYQTKDSISLLQELQKNKDNHLLLVKKMQLH
ncbi:unnamed protein product (macronuclear) [Paramecium tetraurelia]|uniref:ubiquitinyl hydrolase 1 n=1 Tax=Paramecium tetraurelia TaxID=5888 RepID=A0BSG9_PARTE|nr:uncharacterized protein GSPATT00031718001 [Paramecium tetraurelia]CAK61486.1 unnamed protein product [Paramecium tetraurelia]|eukprot:XP_001428884.1 hypothetical protein (macronuclear) [Paramecium tetraurelia strain d4-2]